MLSELIKKNRSYRRFYQDEKISTETLLELVDLGRLSSSAANLQSLKYVLSNDDEKNQVIFNTLGWAGYLKDWAGPEEGEKPSAYLILVNDTSISKNPAIDVGIASTNILLAAVEKGLGGCMLLNVNKKVLAPALNLSDNQEIAMVIALGKPKEEVILESVSSSSDIKYWRDENQTHHVPKRKLEDIIIK